MRLLVTFLVCYSFAAVLTIATADKWRQPTSQTRAIFELLKQEAFEFLLDMPNELLQWEQVENIRNYAIETSTTQDNYDFVSCTVCKAGVTGFNALIANNYTWPDVRDEAVFYCELIFNNTLGSLVGETMCTGMVDNYGPELFNIFTIKPASNAEEVCILYNACVENRTTISFDVEEPVVIPSQPASRPNNILGNKSAVGKSAANIRIVHMTDIHVEEDYLEGSASDCGLYVCCLAENVGTGSANYWGDYHCNVPPRTVELFYQFIADMDPPADFILYTGDNPPHTAWEETREGQLAVSRYVAETMYRILPPGSTAYPVIGNHENFPENLYYTDREVTQEFNREFINYWQPLAKWTTEQHDTILRAGYYTLLIRPGLRLVAFNTNYGYTFNWYNWINIDRPEYHDMRQFINDSLRDAETAGEKVILLSHHPSNNGDGIIEWGQFIKAILLRYYEIIVLYPFGHTHKDEFRVAVDDATGEAREVMLGGGTSNSQSLINPNIRIIEMDPVTFEVIDYSHYALDIEPDDRNASIQFLYSALEEYSLPDFSASSWYDLTISMEEVGSATFNKYYDNMFGRSGVQEECNARCKSDLICGLRTISYDEYRDCAGRGGV